MRERRATLDPRSGADGAKSSPKHLWLRKQLSPLAVIHHEPRPVFSRAVTSRAYHSRLIGRSQDQLGSRCIRGRSSHHPSEGADQKVCPQVPLARPAFSHLHPSGSASILGSSPSKTAPLAGCCSRHAGQNQARQHKWRSVNEARKIPCLVHGIPRFKKAFITLGPEIPLMPAELHLCHCEPLRRRTAKEQGYVLTPEENKLADQEYEHWWYRQTKRHGAFLE